MATLADFRKSITSVDLHERFEAACLKAAAYVTAEAVGAPNHAARLAWANQVIPDEAYTAATAKKILRWGLATNATLQNASVNATDNDIDYVVSAAIGDAVVLEMVN